MGASWSGLFEDCEDCCLPGVDFVPFHVDEDWQGQALLHLEDLPAGDPGAPGAWSDHEHAGLYTHNDALYRWTMCRECGLLGAQYGGYADRLACRCRDGHKDDNSSDPRPLDAYRAARDLFTSLSGTSCDADTAGRTVRRASLVDQQGMTAALDRCIGQCFSLDEQLRADLPAGAFAESTQDADVLCGQCPGFVCAECAARPAPTLGEHCQDCRPRVQITYRRARQLLNTQAA